METATFTIRGLTPLLQHNGMAMLDDNKGSRGTSIPSAEDEAEQGTYRDQYGQLCVLGAAIRASIVKAGGQHKSGRGMSRMSGSLASSFVTEELLPLKTEEGEKIEKFELDVRRAVIKATGNGVRRARPRFDKWQVDFTLMYDETMEGATEDRIREVLADAGTRIGIGDYRPEKKGPYGRFEVL